MYGLPRNVSNSNDMWTPCLQNYTSVFFNIFQIVCYQQHIRGKNGELFKNKFTGNLNLKPEYVLRLRTCDTTVTRCKVIRIGKRVQPDISKARQQVNIDRPAYNKTDKQCRTRTTITARLPDG